MAEINWQRIHPLTLVIEGGRAIRRLIFVVVIFVITSLTNQQSDETRFELYAGLLGLVVIFVAAVRYFSFRYSVHQGQLMIQSGIITKNVRTIPLERIQNINLTRTLLHRVLNLVDLEIETGSGTKAEASISALTEAQAQELKAQLLSHGGTSSSSQEAEGNNPNQKRVIYVPTPRELLLAGASENRLLAMIGFLAGIQFLIPNLIDYFEKNSGLFQSTGSALATWLLAALGLLILFTVGWFISILTTFVKYFGFEITEEGGKIGRSYGLLNHVENVLPIKRIQTVVHSQNWLQRKFGISKIFVSTAGSFGSSNQGDGNSQVSTSPLLTPVIRDEAVPTVLRLVFPTFHWHDLSWHRVGKKTVQRHVRSALIPTLMLGIGAWIAFNWWAVAVVVGSIGIALLAGLIYLKTGKWAESQDMVVSRKGLFKLRYHYIPTSKVQCTEIRQSPVQRRLSLATVGLFSASPTFQETEVDDIDMEDARDLALSVHDKSGRGRDSLIDGM